MSRDPDAALDPELAAQVLRDAEALRDPAADPDLEAVRTAILIEDSLGIVLTDADIAPEVLGDPDALARLVERRGRA